MAEKSLSQKIISFRSVIQWISGAALVAGIGWFHLDILWVLPAGILTAPFGGNFFCRWVCPMGLMMETLTRGLDPESRAQQNYMYY